MSVYYKKILILKQVNDICTINNRQGSAILKAERTATSVRISVALYNIRLDNDFKLTLRSENLPVQQFDIKNGKLDTLVDIRTNIEKHISCTVFKAQNTEFTPILWGSTDKELWYDSYSSASVHQPQQQTTQQLQFVPSGKVEEIKQSRSVPERPQPQKTVKPQPQKPQVQTQSEAQPQVQTQSGAKSQTHTDTKPQAETVKPLSKQLDEVKIALDELEVAKGRAAMYEYIDETVATENYFIKENVVTNTNIKNYLDKLQPQSFYQSIESELKKLEESCPKEDALCNLISNSNFVRVKYKGDTYYAVGVIYQDRQPQCIVYAVPGVYSQQPPQDLGNSRYLPLNDEKGYWLICQCAKTGEVLDNYIL